MALYQSGSFLVICAGCESTTLRRRFIMLTRLIAHRIGKKAHESKSSVRLRDKVLPTDSTVASDLFEQLRDSFQRKNPVAGTFLTTGDTKPRFQQILERYIGADDEPGFVSFTAEAMRILRDEIVTQQAATGGYVIFAEYQADNTKFLFAALLGTTAKPSFDKDLNLIESPSLDLDHLRHGARVRFDKVGANDNGVVLFISQKSSGASDYFVNFIGCEEITTPDQQGRILYTALNSWASTQDFNDDQRGQLLQNAYSFWRDCRDNNRAMTLTGIANALNPQDSTALLRYLGAESNQLAGEFPAPPPSVMKRFVKFTFNKAGLRLEFDRNSWANEVRVNPKAKTLTIMNVPDELITALAEDL
jgi:nucleoid-associated protein